MSNLIPVLEQAFIIGTIAFVMILSIVKLFCIILLMIDIFFFKVVFKLIFIVISKSENIVETFCLYDPNVHISHSG